MTDISSHIFICTCQCEGFPLWAYKGISDKDTFGYQNPTHLIHAIVKTLPMVVGVLPHKTVRNPYKVSEYPGMPVETPGAYIDTCSTTRLVKATANKSTPQVEEINI